MACMSGVHLWLAATTRAEAVGALAFGSQFLSFGSRLGKSAEGLESPQRVWWARWVGTIRGSWTFGAGVGRRCAPAFACGSYVFFVVCPPFYWRGGCVHVYPHMRERLQIQQDAYSNNLVRKHR